jgi:hypothetical protein
VVRLLGNKKNRRGKQAAEEGCGEGQRTQKTKGMQVLHGNLQALHRPGKNTIRRFEGREL